MPPLPPYDGLHPIVVHFPIALLLVAPLFLLLGAVWKSQSRAMFLAASTLMTLGAATMLLALSTGEAGEDAAKRIPGTRSLLHEHEEAAELARNLFLALTVLWIGLTAAYWRLHERVPRTVRYAAAALYLAAYAASATVLLDTAHKGGRLVHELGVRAWSASPATKE